MRGVVKDRRVGAGGVRVLVLVLISVLVLLLPAVLAFLLTILLW